MNFLRIYEKKLEIRVCFQISYRINRLIGRLEVGNVYFSMFHLCKTKRENVRISFS